MSSRPLTDRDLALFLLAHKSIRGDLESFVRTASTMRAGDQARATRLVTFFGLLQAMVHHHHHGEDTQLYPMLSRKDASFDATRDRLERDHGTLDPMLLVARAALEALADASDAEFDLARDRLVAALQPLRDAMADHLEREEAAVVPRLLQYVTYGELKALETEMAKGISYTEMAMLLPWAASRASEEELAMLYDVLPWPVKMLYRLSWKSRFDKISSPLAA